jgi:hypothetical protein
MILNQQGLALSKHICIFLIKMTITHILRRCYMLIHTPVELARPVIIHVAPACKYTNTLFHQYVEKTEAARQNGESRYLMSKREIEKWTPFFPTGARVQALEMDIRPYEWELLNWSNGSPVSRQP